MLGLWVGNCICLKPSRTLHQVAWQPPNSCKARSLHKIAKNLNQQFHFNFILIIVLCFNYLWAFYILHVIQILAVKSIHKICCFARRTNMVQCGCAAYVYMVLFSKSETSATVSKQGASVFQVTSQIIYLYFSLF